MAYGSILHENEYSPHCSDLVYAGVTCTLFAVIHRSKCFATNITVNEYSIKA